MSNAKTPTLKQGVHEQDHDMDKDRSASSAGAPHDSVPSFDWGYFAEAALAAGVALATVLALDHVANASPSDNTVPAVYRHYITEAPDSSEPAQFAKPSDDQASEPGASIDPVSSEHRDYTAEAAEPTNTAELLSSELRSGDSTDHEQHHDSIGGDDGANVGR